MAGAVARSLRHLRRISTAGSSMRRSAALFVVMVAVEATREPMAGARLGLLAILTLVLAACIVLRRRFPFAALVCRRRR